MEIIFTTRVVVRLDPESGCIDGIADLGVLWQAMNPEEEAEIDTSESVLNGIAYDPKTVLFYLTGKLWKTISRGASPKPPVNGVVKVYTKLDVGRAPLV